MGVNIKNHNLEHTDRLGKKQSSRTKPRPVFVKFVRYNDRRKVFSIKKMKASDNSITESLPPFRMGATCERARRVGIQKCLDLRWSNNLYKWKFAKNKRVLRLKNVVKVELRKMEQVFSIFFLGYIFLYWVFWTCKYVLFCFLHWQYTFGIIFWSKNCNSFIIIY